MAPSRNARCTNLGPSVADTTGFVPHGLYAHRKSFGMRQSTVAYAVLCMAALGAAAPAAASGGAGLDVPHVVVTTVCTIYSDQLGAAVAGMDAVLGTGIGGHMPECEVTAEYVGPAAHTAPEPSVMVDIPPGALFPACDADYICFTPNTVVVDVGDRVVWANSDTVLHTVTDQDGAFDGWMLPGEEFAFTFDTPGTYPYGCTVHPWARGVVVVGSEADRYHGLKFGDAFKVTQGLVHMYDSRGTVAFDAVNRMVSEDVYPFAVDAETLTVVAEGAFPQVVGLPATFLQDADRPLDSTLDALGYTEGVWVEYVFLNPETASYEAKTSYLTLHDGHIFGSGFYTSPDVGATDAVNTLSRLYDILGEGAFADMESVPAGVFNTPFVLDADTLDIVAHADPNLAEGDIRDAITSGTSLDFVLDALDRHGSLWLSYPSVGNTQGSEYTRAYMLLRDGYVLASGYGVDADVRLQSLIDESVRLYEREGDAAFGAITSMGMTRQAVYDLEEYTTVANSESSQLVGAAVQPSSLGIGHDLEEFLQLHEQGGAWSDKFEGGADSGEMRTHTWSVLHGGYLFDASRAYSPEAAAAAEVEAAISLYETYGEAAFDRITWQAVSPAIIYPFVFDAETWRTVAHAAYPDRLGMLPASIMADNDLDYISGALNEAGDAWVSYQFYNPVTGLVEHKSTYLALHDGYIFAAGYYYGNFDQAEAVIAGAISEYDANGEAAFEAINSEASGGLDLVPLVLDRTSLDVVAHGGHPQLVGQNVNDIAANGDDLASSIRANLAEDGDFVLATSSTWDPQTGSPVLQSVIFQLHGGYVFAAAQPTAVYTQ